MASVKAIPTLPASSRMQMPVSFNSTSSIIREKAGMSGSPKGVTKKIMSMASKRSSGMKGSNPYC